MNNIQRQKNGGSTVVEVTLIMPIILMIMVLFITMLISVLQQAKIHAELMIKAVDEAVLSNTILPEADKQVYEQKVEVELVQGYPIISKEQIIYRNTNTEECLRRWQLVESFVTE